MKKTMQIKSNHELLFQVINELTKKINTRENLSINDFRFLQSFLSNAEQVNQIKIKTAAEECAFDHLRLLLIQLEHHKNNGFISHRLNKELKNQVNFQLIKDKQTRKNDSLMSQIEKSIY